MNHSPLAFSCRVRLVPPSTDDKTADKERLLGHLSRLGMTEVEAPLNVLRKFSEELRTRQFEVDIAMGVTARGLRILDISRRFFTVWRSISDQQISNVLCLTLSVARR